MDKSGGELGPIRRRVHFVERKSVERWIVEGPLESGGRIAGGEQRIQERTMRGALHYKGDIFAAADMNDFAIEIERMPLRTHSRRFGTFVVAFAVEFLDV